MALWFACPSGVVTGIFIIRCYCYCSFFRKPIFPDAYSSWLDGCLNYMLPDHIPSRREFSDRVRRRIDEVMGDRIPPMTSDTLKEKNRELYRTLRLADAH